jgi:hypothetical protein
MNPALLTVFNQYNGDRKTLIRKGLDSSVGAGMMPYSPLIAQKLEKIITNELVRLSPELAVIQSEYDSQKYHEFNKLIALPNPDGFMGESATTPTYNSQYVRDKVELKILRRKGTVTNFLQDASKNYIDASAAEMENHLQAHAYDMITGLLWGNSSANKYSIDGLDHMIVTHRWNQAAGGSVPQDLSFLDEMIDANMEKQGANHKKVFLMSPQMQSLISRLLTNVRLQQGGPSATVEIDGGWRLESYRNIPILPVSSMNSKKRKMGTVAAASGTTNYFRVAVVTYDGESEASDSVQAGTAAGAGLTWTPEPGAFYYKVYAGASATTLKLVSIVPAHTYDVIGTYAGEVAGVTFTTDPTLPNPTATLVAPSGVLTGVVAGDAVKPGMQGDVPLVSTGGVVPEEIVLWDLDKHQGLGKVPYTNSGGDRFQGLVTVVPLAVTDDNLPFLLRTYFALCPSFEATSVISKGWRTR